MQLLKIVSRKPENSKIQKFEVWRKRSHGALRFVTLCHLSVYSEFPAVFVLFVLHVFIPIDCPEGSFISLRNFLVWETLY
jgi:hypothetical protein